MARSRRRGSARKGGSGKRSAGGHGHREIGVSSWAEFVELATGDEFKNWAFRGHSDHSWGLDSTLARHLRNHEVQPKVWPHQEKRVLRIFRRKAHHFLDHLPDPGDSFCWLALMQHHGSPTRLLDLSWSPYVAAFFALERVVIKDSVVQDSAIWALNAAAIECESDHLRTSLGLPGDFDIRGQGHIEESLISRSADVVFIGEPQEMNRRLIAQSGTFALQGALDKPIDQILAAYPGHREYAVKIVLETASLRREAMRELYHMNLTPATLFPDLDGLARSLAYELEFHWGFDPHTAKPHRGFNMITDKRGVLRQVLYD